MPDDEYDKDDASYSDRNLLADRGLVKRSNRVAGKASSRSGGSRRHQVHNLHPIRKTNSVNDLRTVFGTKIMLFSRIDYAAIGGPPTHPFRISSFGLLRPTRWCSPRGSEHRRSGDGRLREKPSNRPLPGFHIKVRNWRFSRNLPDAVGSAGDCQKN